MSVREHQLRTLKLCRVYSSAAAAPGAAGAPSPPAAPPAGAGGGGAARGDHLLVLTVDHLALIHDGGGTDSDGDGDAGGGGAGGRGVFALGLSQVLAARAEGRALRIDFVPSAAGALFPADAADASASPPVGTPPPRRILGRVRKSASGGGASPGPSPSPSFSSAAAAPRSAVWQCESAAAAAELAAAVAAATARLADALLWLDRGLPAGGGADLAVAAAAASGAAGKAVLAEGGGCDWGATLRLPPGWGAAPADELCLYVSSPLGPVTAAAAPRALAAAAADAEGAGALRLVARPRPAAAAAGAPASGAPRFQVEVICRVSRAPAAGGGGERAGAQGPRWLLLAGLACLVAAALVAKGQELSAGARLPPAAAALALAAALGAAAAAAAARAAPRGAAREQYLVHLVGAELVEVEDAAREGPGPAARPPTKLARQPSKLARHFDKALSVRGPAMLRDLGGGGGGAATRRVLLSRRSMVASRGGAGGLSPAEAAALAALARRSPAITPSLFARFAAACRGDRDAALERLAATAAWRAASGVDAALSEPAPHFDAVRAAYPLRVAGRCRDGAPLVFEAAGRFRGAAGALAAAGVPPSALLHAYVFSLEYLVRCALGEDWCAPGQGPLAGLDGAAGLERGGGGPASSPPAHGGRFVRVFDMAGVRLGDAADRDAAALARELLATVEAHYPERTSRVYVVNAPAFFPALYRVVAPLLDPRTRAKIRVVGSRRAAVAAALGEVAEPAEIPRQYGGEGVEDLADAADERRLAALVARCNAALGCGGGGAVAEGDEDEDEASD